MTRINVVPVRELHDKHLLAEYRELPRVFAAAKKWFQRGGTPAMIPPHYKMGKGHVMFFYNKLHFCYHRQVDIYRECKRRGFRVTIEPRYEQLIGDAPRSLRLRYKPTREALRLNRERIAERLETMRT